MDWRGLWRFREGDTASLVDLEAALLPGDFLSRYGHPALHPALDLRSEGKAKRTGALVS